MSKLTLVEGWSEAESEREERERRVYEFLNRLQIPFWRTDHRHADTMEACRSIESVLNCSICKNLFLCNRQQTSFFLLLMPGDKPFRTKELSKQIHSARLSFAPEDKMSALLNVKPGSVSVMGLMNDGEYKVQLLVDEDILKEEYFACHPCVNTSSIKIRRKDLFEIFFPSVKHSPIFVRLS